MSARGWLAQEPRKTTKSIHFSLVRHAVPKLCRLTQQSLEMMNKRKKSTDSSRGAMMTTLRPRELLAGGIQVFRERIPGIVGRRIIRHVTIFGDVHPAGITPRHLQQ